MHGCDGPEGAPHGVTCHDIGHRVATCPDKEGQSGFCGREWWQPHLESQDCPGFWRLCPQAGKPGRERSPGFVEAEGGTPRQPG